jgi:uncharacterized membrane protein
MTMCVLAFMKTNISVLLALMSPLFLVLIIRAVREMRIFERQTSVVVAVCTYMFCFVGLMRFVFDDSLFKLTDPDVTNLLVMLISYASVPFSIVITAIIGAAVKLFWQRKGHVVEY